MPAPAQVSRKAGTFAAILIAAWENIIRGQRGGDKFVDGSVVLLYGGLVQLQEGVMTRYRDHENLPSFRGNVETA